MSVKLGAIITQLGTGDFKLLNGKDIDIKSSTELTSGTGVADADVFLVDDGDLGTQASTKKVKASTLKSYINAGTSTSLDISKDGVDTGFDLAVGTEALDFVGTSDEIEWTITESAGSAISVQAGLPSAVKITTSLDVPLISTTADLTFRIDNDGGDTSKFAFKNGADSEIASIDESGNTVLGGTLKVSGGTVKDSGDNTIFTLDGSGGVTIAGHTAGAEQNVQSDWNEVSAGSDAHILNKPNVAYTSAISAGNNGLVPAAGSAGEFLAHNGAFATPSGDYATDAQHMAKVLNGYSSASGAGTSLSASNTVIEAFKQLDTRVNLNDGKNSCTAGNVGSVISGITGDFQIGDGASSQVVTMANDLIVSGDLTVSGTTTTLNVTNLDVADKIIKLADTAAPTIATGDDSGIQIETGATEDHWPELKWQNGQGNGNTDGSSTNPGLTGWQVSNHHTSNMIDLPIAVMEFSADSTPPSGIAGGIGSFHFDTGNAALYVRTA